MEYPILEPIEMWWFPGLSSEASRAAILRETLHSDRVELERRHRDEMRQREFDHDEASRFDRFDSTAMDLAGLATLEPPPPLIHDNVLYQGTTAWLVGASGTYKSFLALDWALSIAYGHAWLDRHEVEHGSVLYIAGEGLAGLSKRVAAWQQWRKVEGVAPIRFMRAVDLAKPQMRDLIELYVQARRPKMIVLDTQARVLLGVSENDKDEMDPFIDFITNLADRYRVTVLTLHHSTKSGSDPIRGSGSIQGAADTVIKVEREQGERKVKMTIIKHKDTESEGEMNLELVHYANSLVVTNSAGEEEVIGIKVDDNMSQRVYHHMLAVLESTGFIGMSKTEISAEMRTLIGKDNPLSRSLPYKTIARGVSHRHIVPDGHDRAARYTLTAEGRAQLARYRASIGENDESTDY